MLFIVTVYAGRRYRINNPPDKAPLSRTNRIWYRWTKIPSAAQVAWNSTARLLHRAAEMVKRSKLLQTLDFHKGRDYDAEKQKKLVRAAEKRKAEKKRKRIEAGEIEEEVNVEVGLSMRCYGYGY